MLAALGATLTTVPRAILGSRAMLPERTPLLGPVHSMYPHGRVEACVEVRVGAGKRRMGPQVQAKQNGELTHEELRWKATKYEEDSMPSPERFHARARRAAGGSENAAAHKNATPARPARGAYFPVGLDG